MGWSSLPSLEFFDSDVGMKFGLSEFPSFIEDACAYLWGDSQLGSWGAPTYGVRVLIDGRDALQAHLIAG